MYKTNTKTKVEQYIEGQGIITYNKLQYLGLAKKQIHHTNLMPILNDLVQENKIEIISQDMNGRMYRVIKWKPGLKAKIDGGREIEIKLSPEAQAELNEMKKQIEDDMEAHGLSRDEIIKC